MPKSVSGTGHDPIIPYALLHLDDEKYRLVLDFNALAEAESITGMNLLQGMVGFVLNSATVSQYRGLLFAALHRLHPKITLEEVGRMMSMTDLLDIKSAIVAAYNLSMPEKKRLAVEEVQTQDPVPASA